MAGLFVFALRQIAVSKYGRNLFWKLEDFAGASEQKFVINQSDAQLAANLSFFLGVAVIGESQLAAISSGVELGLWSRTASGRLALRSRRVQGDRVKIVRRAPLSTAVPNS